MAKKGPTKARVPQTKPCAYCVDDQGKPRRTTVTAHQAQQNTEFARYPHSPVVVAGYPPLCAPATTAQVARALLEHWEDDDAVPAGS
jgi:hypothetical protein